MMPAGVYIRTPVPLNAYRLNSRDVDLHIRNINSEIRKTSALIKRTLASISAARNRKNHHNTSEQAQVPREQIQVS
jgi:hypothetical protein